MEAQAQHIISDADAELNRCRADLYWQLIGSDATGSQVQDYIAFINSKPCWMN